MSARDAPAASEPILFEAVSTPPRSLSPRGMRWLCALAVAGAMVPAVLFTLLGAWPVLPFIGVEVALVLGMVALHRQWTSRQVEVVMLTPERLCVIAADGRGGTHRVELQPYWARLDMTEVAGAVPTLRLTARGKSVEIGRFLSAGEKSQLQEALAAALRSYRSPTFNNPQLRQTQFSLRA